MLIRSQILSQQQTHLEIGMEENLNQAQKN
jgi:hypothetical protein